MASKSTITIGFKIDDSKDGLKQLTMDADGLRKAMQGAVVEVGKLSDNSLSFASVATLIEKAQNGLMEFQGVVSDLASAYRMQEEAETKLATVMQTRMDATEQEIQSIKDLCSAQQELGIIGDEVQLAGAQQLATFLNSRQALEQLIPAMNDLIAQQKGFNATQGDAAGIANLFGKAMQGQTSALRRVGITFNEAEEASLKTGDEFQRAAALAEIITKNVGHMNAELAKTDAGKQKQLENTLGDIKEQAGAIVGKIQPYLTLAASATTAFTGLMKLKTGIMAVYTSIKTLNVETGAMKTLMVLGTGSATKGAQAMRLYAAGTKTATLSTIALKGAIRGLMIATGVGAAIWALTEIIGYFADKADKASQSVGEMETAIDETKAARDQMNRSIAESTTQLQLDIAATKNFNGTKAEEEKLVSELNTRYGETIGYMSSVAGWYKTLTENSEAYTKQMTLEAQARLLANQIAENNIKIADLKKQPKLYDQAKDQKKGGKPNPLGGSFGLSDLPDTAKKYDALNESMISAREAENKKLQDQLDDVTREMAENSKNIKTAATPKGRPTSAAKPSGSGRSEVLKPTEKPEPIEEPTINNQAETLAEIQANLEVLNKQLQQATSNNAGEINKQIAKWDELREAILNAGNDVNPDAKNLDEIGKNISILQSRLKKASEEEATEINQSISEWSKKAEAIQSAGKKMEINPGAKTLEEIENNISTLQERLNEATEQEAVAINKSIDAWEKKADAIRNAGKETKSTSDILVSAYGNVKSMGDAVENISSALEGNGNAWQKITAVIDGFIQIFQGMQALIPIINMFTQATKLQTSATEEKTAAEGASIGTTLGAAGAEMVLAGSESAESGANLPFPANIAAIAAGVAAVLAVVGIIAGLAGSFATGGIVGGNSYTGDRLMARVNSGEMILNKSQQGKLFRMINSPGAYDRLFAHSGGAEPTKVELKIKDRELIGFIEKSKKRIYRS